VQDLIKVFRAKSQKEGQRAPSPLEKTAEVIVIREGEEDNPEPVERHVEEEIELREVTPAQTGNEGNPVRLGVEIALKLV
jgi:hypothetical protein